MLDPVDPDEGGEAPCMAHLFNDPGRLTDGDVDLAPPPEL